jgi:class 3 adenylate cyclase
MDQRPTGTVTFLFTDIEGSTKLACPQHRPQNLRQDLRQNVRRCLSSQVTRSASANLQLLWRWITPGAPILIRQCYSPFMSVEERALR